eukprot:353724-Chlamydomonas_euryale.AAC.4
MAATVQRTRPSPRPLACGTVRFQGAHMTWLPLSREGKFQRMRDGMLYNDPTEYYNGPKFLAAGARQRARLSGYCIPAACPRHPH